MANGPPEEGAYQCFFNRDDLPSPMEGGTLCDFPLAQLSGFPDHEEHFPLYTGARLEDMVESIRRHGVQSPILVWKTAELLKVLELDVDLLQGYFLAKPSAVPKPVSAESVAIIERFRKHLA